MFKTSTFYSNTNTIKNPVQKNRLLQQLEQPVPDLLFLHLQRRMNDVIDDKFGRKFRLSRSGFLFRFLA